MKTVEQLEQDLAILQTALKDTQAIVNERGTRSYVVQSMTSRVVLGNATKQDLIAAQAALEECVEALPRLAALQTSIATVVEQIAFAKGRERKQSCDQIKDEHASLYADYKAASKALLAQFRQLQHLNNCYVGLTGRPLHGGHEIEINLPAVTGPLCARSNISTGQE